MRTPAFSRALLPALLLAVAASAVPDLALADNVNPLNDGSQYAYGENIGWLNAQPQGPGGPGMLVEDFSVTGWLWSENLGWVSLSCANTATCGRIAYGVTNDGFGHLSGFAWSENAGWINFASASAEVTIDPTTGNFSGSAWGENVGWITFSAASPVAYKIQTSWCQGTGSPPTGAPSLTLTSAGATTQLAWTSLTGAGWYDVVRGDLVALRNSGGNFTTATQSCVNNNLMATSAAVSTALGVGKGIWFLVRGEDCKGNGTYDEGGAQVGSRDAEIDASGSTCP
jgi:hypothetical protein